MDLTVLNLAVPRLTAALRPTSTELLWIVDIYGFADLPADALEAVRDTLGGALSVAGALPDQLGAALVSASRSAYVEAFRATALASAAITLTAAVATALLFGRGSDPQRPATPG
jgi:DHA2 family multidrug resistance protein-like MFS transporter